MSGRNVRKMYPEGKREAHCSTRQPNKQTAKAGKVPTYDTRAISAIKHNSFVRGSICASLEPLLTYCPKVIFLESSITGTLFLPLTQPGVTHLYVI